MIFLTGIGTWLQNWASVIGAIGSLLLTAALVGLYHAQHRVVKKQLERETEPEITTENISVGDLPESNTTWESYFVFTLSNIGNGEATNMTVTIEPTLIQSEFDLEPSNRDLNRKPSKNSDSEVTLLTKGNHLQPQERHVDFAVPAITGLFSQAGAPHSGHFTLSDLPEAIAKAKLDTGLWSREYPDRETKEKTTYQIQLPDDDRVASLVYDELDVEDLPVEIEESSRTVLVDEEIADIVNSQVGTLFVRIKLILNFDTPDGRTEELELMDKVFPSRYGVSSSVLFRSGMDYDTFTLDDNKNSDIERRMFVNIAQEQKENQY